MTQGVFFICIVFIQLSGMFFLFLQMNIFSVLLYLMCSTKKQMRNIKKKKELILKYFYAELIHGSIIRPIVTRDIHAPSKNEIIQNNKNLYLIPDFEDIKVPDDFATDTSPESYQPPADILKLIFFNHNRLVKHISSLEKSPSPKDTPRQFDKNTKLQNLSLMLTIIQK